VPLSSWGVAWDGVEVPEGDVRECSRLEKSRRVQSGFTFTRRNSRLDLHEFLDLALVATHDGLKVSGFKNNTTSDQDNVVAAGQKRNAVRDEDPSFGRKQTARSDDMVCEGSIG